MKGSGNSSTYLLAVGFILVSIAFCLIIKLANLNHKVSESILSLGSENWRKIKRVKTEQEKSDKNYETIEIQDKCYVSVQKVTYIKFSPDCLVVWITFFFLC